MEPIRRIRSCPLDLESHGSQLCPLHRRLDEALASVEKAFGETTLANVLEEPSPSVPLCQFPALPDLHKPRAEEGKEPRPRPSET